MLQTEEGIVLCHYYMFLLRQSPEMSEGSPCSRLSTNQNLLDKEQALLKYFHSDMAMTGTDKFFSFVSSFCLSPFPALF